MFHAQNLDKTPLADAPMEPYELVDPTRYQFSSKVLSDEDEELCAAALDRLKSIISRRGTPVKPFFDDAASDNNSSKLYGHVTLSQFRCARMAVQHACTATGACGWRRGRDSEGGAWASATGRATVAWVRTHACHTHTGGGSLCRLAG